MSSVAVMDVDLLYVPDCPNRERVRQRLGEALGAAGIAATIREIEIPTAEAAEAAGMHGSPTVLIDGRDPFATDGPVASMSCRLYRTSGSLDGAPSVRQLIDALAKLDG